MKISKEESLSLFNSDEIRIVEISGGKKWFIPSFIEFQYGHLSEKNRAHNSVILALKKLGLLNEDLSLKNENKELVSPLQGGKDKAKEQDKEKEQDKVIPDTSVVYDAEREILKNQIQFEKICMSTGKSAEQAKDSLHKYHLFLEEKEQYPKSKKAVFAGFEKWLLNERTQVNGKNTAEPHSIGRTLIHDKP